MRIIYWNTSCLEPRIEAVSKEIFSLAHHFTDSFIFGVSRHYWFKLSIQNHYIGLNASLDPFLRLIVPLFELKTDINHVYGEVSPWLYHKALHKKPILLTIASEKGCGVLSFLERCKAIVVQTEGMQSRLLKMGIESVKIRLVYPGVDLIKFRPSDRFNDLKNIRILFATAPRTKEELEQRGVNFLVFAAKTLQHISFHLLFRKWQTKYTSLLETQDLIKGACLTNVTLTDAIVMDMASTYQSHHFTIVPTIEDGGKECPNSLIESLACGVPVLVSAKSPFAYFVKVNNCGEIFEHSPSGLGEAIEKSLNKYDVLRKQARTVAETYFNKARMLYLYSNLYNSMLRRNHY